VYHAGDILRKFLGHNFVSGLRTLIPKKTYDYWFWDAQGHVTNSQTLCLSTAAYRCCTCSEAVPFWQIGVARWSAELRLRSFYTLCSSFKLIAVIAFMEKKRQEAKRSGLNSIRRCKSMLK